MPIIASFIQGKIVDHIDRAKVTPLRKDSATDNSVNQ